MFHSLQIDNNTAWDEFLECSEIFKSEVNEETRIIHFTKQKPTQNIKKTHPYIRKNCIKKKIVEKQINFNRVFNKLKFKTTQRKYVDQRLFWKYNNIFLCKGRFTLGVINVPSILSVGHSPVDLYLLPNSYPDYYLPESSRFFKKHEIAPYTTSEITGPFILICKSICLFELIPKNPSSPYLLPATIPLQDTTSSLELQDTTPSLELQDDTPSVATTSSPDEMEFLDSMESSSDAKPWEMFTNSLESPNSSTLNFSLFKLTDQHLILQETA